jgi:hypothetical protein
MRTNKLTTLGAAIIVVAGIGIGVASAATTGTSVKACESATGFLRVVNKHNHCPSGTKKVTIAKQGPVGPRGPRGFTGPRGPQGPGARAMKINLVTGTATKTITLPAGDQLSAHCSDGAGDFGQGQLTISPPASTDTSLDYGTADIQNISPGIGTLTVGNGGFNAAYTDPHNQISQFSTGQWTLSFISTGGSSQYSAHLLVMRGTTSFTLDVLGASQASGSAGGYCIMGVQVTPAG